MRPNTKFIDMMKNSRGVLPDSSTVLLMHFDGDLLDYSGRAHHATNNITFPASITSDYKQFGYGQSLNTNLGGSSYIECDAHSDWDLGTTFTIDGWFNTNSRGTHAYRLEKNIVGTGFSGANWQVVITSQEVAPGAGVYESRLVFWANGMQAWCTLSSNLQIDTWYHFAIVRTGSTSATWKFFANGTEKTKTLFSGSYAPTLTSTGAKLSIGNNGSNTHADGCKIDELRISSNARWSADFTPQNIPY